MMCCVIMDRFWVVLYCLEFGRLDVLLNLVFLRFKVCVCVVIFMVNLYFVLFNFLVIIVVILFVDLIIRVLMVLLMVMVWLMFKVIFEGGCLVVCWDMDIFVFRVMWFFFNVLKSM